MQGAVIIATGYRGFGVMAENLAVSIKALMPDLPVCIIHDSHVRPSDIWNDRIQVADGLNPFHLKTKIYDLSPYSQTLYIDADSLFIRDLIPLMDSLKGKDFAMMEYRRYVKGDTSKMIWADLPSLWNAYGLADDAILPEYNSSVFYFEKGKKARKLFKQAEKCYGANVALKEKVRRKFPDEVAFSAASALTGIHSEMEMWQPAFVEWPSNRGMDVPTIRKKFHLVTMSGKAIPGNNIGHIYNGLGTRFATEIKRQFTLWNTRMKPA